MRRMRLFCVLAVLVGAAIAGTAALTLEGPPPAEATIAPPQAHARAKAGALTLIDLRTPREWRETGVPPHAATANFNALSEEAFIARVEEIAENARAEPIALICARGGRSSRARETLLEAGFSRVVDVHEGMLGNASGPGWIDRGLPTAKSR